jgi:hypothetical protein
VPYIKKNLRPVLDSAVILAQQGKWADAKTRILLGIRDEADSSKDGCLNYAFTQLFRKMNVEEAETVIHMVIYDVYLVPPKYFKLERLLGLLESMAIEFERRKWHREGCRDGEIRTSNENILAIIKRLKRYVVETHYITYEEKKIKENGDLS